MVSKRVILWSAPRCLSTAFERSITTLSRIQVLHEPFTNAYYFGPEKQSTRCHSQLAQPTSSYSNICETILQDFEKADAVFSKDMAYHVENKLEMFAEERFKDLKHTFLICDPAKSIPSLYRISTSKELSGWDYFDPTECGVRQVYELYEFVTKRIGIDPDPIVVDADDLLDNPDEMMKTYCNAVGLTYEPHMTKWEKGDVPQWTGPQVWRKTVVESTGFMPRKKEPLSGEVMQSLPQDVLQAIEDARPYYQKLAAKRILLQRP